jgi:LPXTG-site transpeptidase (sortase) family protein
MNDITNIKLIPAAKLLSLLNNILTGVILAGCIYILVMPYLASLNTQVKALQDKTGGLVYETRLADEYKIDKTQLKSIPTDNRLVIPKIFVDGPISTGDTKDALNYGYWKRTNPVPGDKDNLVIAGHRNLFKWTMIDLDKLTNGDLITIYWEGKEHNYHVENTFEVWPSAVEIEAPSDREQLTIYTCTPVLTAAKRLVIIATPI